MSDDRTSILLQEAWQRLWQYYWDDSRLRFYQWWPRQDASCPWADNWAFGAVLAATAATWQALGQPDWMHAHLAQLRQSLVEYANGRARGYASTVGVMPPGDTYYDDNAWVGLASFEMSGANEWDQVAYDVYDFLLEGFDGESGGVFWKETPKASLHVCSTGPTLLLGAQLFRRDPARIAKEPLTRMLTWLEAMRSPDGRYWDHLRPGDGLIDKTFYTYNSGTPIHAMSILEGAAPEFHFEASVQATVRALPLFLDDQGRLPDTPWFNAVLLRALQAVRTVYGLDTPLISVYRDHMAGALNHMTATRDPLSVLQQTNLKSGDVLLLRDAAAAVEILSRLVVFPL
ncbi:MAG: hypothetical protein OWU33_00110 [Firmicutes bacterium]|nr:hypothetical protein [Bacillota bacterium]